MVGYVPTTLFIYKKVGKKMNEVWKDIDGYDGKYQVSNLGNVRSTRFYGHERIRVLKPQRNGKGYLKVGLVDCYGKTRQRAIHRLVAETFIPNPDNLEMVNHKDEDGTNNTVENLEWCTRSYNQLYSLEKHPERNKVFGNNFIKDGESTSAWTKKGVAHTRTEPIIQSTYDGEFICVHENASVAAKVVGGLPSNIYCACLRNARTDRIRKRSKKAGSKGFVWEFYK